MPIVELHIKADDVLFNRVKIENKDDFILGSLFPDCLWSYVDDDKVLNRLHFAKLVGELRLPNYFDFVSAYVKELKWSDFMRGMLFHLLLDYYNNMSWYNQVDIIGNKFKINGAYTIECDSIKCLLKYKYGDMKRYADYNPSSIKLPDTVSASTKGFVTANWYDIDCSLDNMVNHAKQLITNGVEPLMRPLFFDKYYSEIIYRSIAEFESIGVLYGWLFTEKRN